jgi:CheY-like chemotaxis protein
LTTLLRPRCARVVAVADVPEAGRILRAEPPMDRVLAEAATPGGGAPALLGHVAQLADPRPALAILTSRPDLHEEARLVLQGAIAYLTKPVSARDLARLLWQCRTKELPRGDARASGLGLPWATLGDPGGAEQPTLRCEVGNLSASGALLLTHAPLPVGSSFDLELRLGRDTIRLLAEVVRVQEPAWGVLPGVAVAFPRIPEAARQRIERFVAEAAHSARA